jgi:hydroxyacylglutathione hydrolase
VPSSTVGYEKIRNWALQYETDEKGFVQYLLADQPEPPKYFAMMKKLNKVDRPLLTKVPKLNKLSMEDVKKALDKGVKVIDTRAKTDYAKGFIPGTINIQGNNSFATWMGWFVSYEESFILIAEESKLDDLTRKLMRIGLDNIYGYIDNVSDYEKVGGTLSKSEIITAEQLENILKTNHTQIIDLRGASEYKSGHIKGTENIFIGTLEKDLDKIRKDQQVVIHCQAGDRSAIGYSLLYKHGFKNVKNYSGGISEWVNQGKPVVTEV